MKSSAETCPRRPALTLLHRLTTSHSSARAQDQLKPSRYTKQLHPSVQTTPGPGPDPVCSGRRLQRGEHVCELLMDLPDHQQTVSSISSDFFKKTFFSLVTWRQHKRTAAVSWWNVWDLSLCNRSQTLKAPPSSWRICSLCSRSAHTLTDVLSWRRCISVSSSPLSPA